MTVAINQPFINVEDANGNPYVGAKLYVYLAGTTTLASIYSNDILTNSLANPLTSDAAGNFSRAYITGGTYKLRAETSAGVLIWQYDAIDTGLGTGNVLTVASGGTGASTAASARTSLGAAAQTDVDDLATSLAALASTIQNFVSVPQGRLTLTSGVPVLAADVTAGTSVYYTPFIGNQISIWDGTTFVIKSFSELTLTLSASHTANNIYDVFVFVNSNVVTIGTGPLWNTATNLIGARGSGAGTTELHRKNGLWTNANSMTARNGATTYTVDADKGTYVGSIFMDGTNGQISCHVTSGQARKWGVWNAYNREPTALLVSDPTVSWTYASATVRESRGQTNNTATVFCGLPEESVDTRFEQTAGSLLVGVTTSDISIGIGWGVTNAYSGRVGFLRISAIAGLEMRCDMIGHYTSVPFIGIVNVASCESVPISGTTPTIYGAAQMLMTSAWRT